MTTTHTASAPAGALAWPARDGAPTSAVCNRTEVGALPLARLRRVTDYIRDHIDHELTLPELGAVVRMSPFHFARLFRRSTGVSPHRFVVRVRIDRASSLLAVRELSIGQIARRIGFRSPSHFSAVFHRVAGATPRAYRARLALASPGKEVGI